SSIEDLRSQLRTCRLTFRKYIIRFLSREVWRGGPRLDGRINRRRALRRNDRLPFGNEHPVEDLPNAVVDRHPSLYSTPVNGGEPLFELLEHPRQPLRRRSPLQQIPLEPGRELFVGMNRDWLSLSNAEPLADRRHILDEIARSFAVRGITEEALEPIMARLVHKGGGVGVLEKGDEGSSGARVGW